MAQRIGIDVGGTNVKIALVGDDGKIIYSNSIPTRAEMGYEYTINSMKEAIKDLLKETKLQTSDIEGMGFGFPGQIDCQNGIVRLAPNIPGWVNVPIAKIMEEEFSIPTRVDNDVRTAALGELNYGAGVGCQNLVCITVGTGIGSGLVINGKLVRGASNAAGELGHIKLTMDGGPLCGCGDRGCLEAYASGPSIVAMAEEYIRGGKSGDHLRRITIVEIGILQIVEKRRIDLPQLDNVDVGRTQNEGTVLPVTPRVPPHGRCQCPMVIGTTLHVVGDLHLGLRAEGPVVAIDPERGNEPRE